ncbi:hypothetical protein Tco_0100929, partial [Tanacetum coccineum]
GVDDGGVVFLLVVAHGGCDSRVVAVTLVARWRRGGEVRLWDGDGVKVVRGVEMMKVLWGRRSGGGSSEVAVRWEKAAGMKVVSWGCVGDEMMWWGGCSW